MIKHRQPSPARTPTIRHLILVTLLGTPLITPLMRWTVVPCTHDGHLHYHRVAAMRHAWENGLLFSRWLPDLAFGYGYPFFIFREPLPLYLTGAVHRLGFPLPAAGNLLYILSLLAAGWFMYLWARDLLGARGGIVAAVAYMSAPYLLVDALVRGNLVESIALALLPLLCWSGRRFILHGRATPFLIGVLGLAALSLSHNISLLIFTPVLGLYLLVIGLLQPVDRRALLSRLVLLFGLGLGLTIFHTGSALLELDEITINQSTNTRNNDFHYNFATLDEIFAPVPREDPTLINPPLPFRLGWIPAGLALIGLLTLGRHPGREQRWHLILMGLATAVFLLMSLAISEPLWEQLPLIDFVQFPWRFVGRAALPVAFLAGAPFALLPNPHPVAEAGSSGRRLSPGVPTGLLAAAVALLLLEALPNLYPNLCREEPFPTIQTVHDYEHATGLVGVDPEGSYFPKAVQRRPDGSPLEADYVAGRPPQRFDLSTLPEAVTVQRVTYGPNQAELELASPVPFEARYLTFAFPGWHATVDGQPVPITPSVPEGLITFPVAAGQHTVTIHWGLTPTRTLLAGISLICLLTFIVTAAVLGRRRPGLAPLTVPTTVPLREAGLLALLGLAILAFKLGVVDHGQTPLRRAAAPPVAESGNLTAAELQLEGQRLSRDTVPAGATVDIDLAWRALAPPTADYQSNVWLVGPEGAVWSDKETHRPRLYEDAGRTRYWAPGQWAWDSREIQVLPGTPPGQYDIVLTLFPLDTLQPVTLQTAGGAVGPTAVIGQVTVTRPERPPLFQPQFPARQPIAGLTLLGYNQDRGEAAPGDPLLLTLFWEKGTGQLPAELPLELRDEADHPVQRWTLPPARGDYPPAAWNAGERVRGQHSLRLAARLDSGRYRFYLAGHPLGEIIIHAPERQFERPLLSNELGATFAGGIELVGYTLTQEQQQFTLQLVWQGGEEIPVSYRVFVHLVDETGAILAQSDAEPAGWSRPTTGWAPGEYITDTHRLPLPNGGDLPSTFLRIGLYDPASGRRLPVEDDAFVTVPVPAEP